MTEVTDTHVASRAALTHTRQLVVEDVLKLRHLAEARLAPDGNIAALIVHEFDVANNRVVTRLLALTLATGEQRELGVAAERQSNLEWSHDSRSLAFISSGDGDGALIRADVVTGERTTVVSGLGGLLAPRWSPDEAQLAFLAFGAPEIGSARRPGLDDFERVEWVETTPARAGMVDPATGWTRKLWLVPATGGEPQQLTQGLFEDGNSSVGGDLAWSPDGRHLFFTADRSPEWRIHLETSALFRLAIEDGTIEQLSPQEGRAVRPSPSRDGKMVAYLGADSVADPPLQFQRLYVVDLESGERRCVSHGIEWALGTAYNGEVDLPPIWSSDLTAITTLMCRDGSTNAVTIPLDGTALVSLTRGARTVQSLSSSPDKGTHLYFVAEPTRPSELRLMDGGEERTLFSPNAWLDEYELATPESRTCIRHGIELPYWLLMPAGEDKVPAILEIHGGPNNQFSNCFYFDQQLWAAQGYAVVYGNPRGSYGYSPEFYNGCLNDLVGEDALDVLAMLDDAIAADNRIDPEQAAVTGYSYGGYMTNQIITITDRFKAAASGAGITNLFSWVATTDIGRWFEKVYLGGTASERQQDYVDRSPVMQARSIRTPLLIFHGERDTRVPVAQAEEMLYAVLEQGIEAALLRLPGDDHGGIRRVGVGMSSPKHQIAVREAVLDWFDRYARRQ